MDLTITPTASVVAGADGFAYGPAVPIDIGAIGHESPPSPDPGTAGTRVVWGIYPTGTTPAQAASGAVAPLHYRSTLVDDPYYDTSEFPATFGNPTGVLIVSSNQVGDVDPNLPYPSPLTFPRALRWGSPLPLPPVQYSYSEVVDEFLTYRADYLGEIVWEGGPLPLEFVTGSLFREPGDGTINFILSAAAPEPYDTYDTQTDYNALRAGPDLRAYFEWTGDSWSGSGDSNQDLAAGPYHLTVLYTNARVAEPPVTDAVLARGFTLHELFSGVGQALVPGSAPPPTKLRDYGAATSSHGLGQPQIEYFISGQVNGEMDTARATAYALYDDVVEIKPADAGTQIAIPAGAAILMIGVDENSGVNVVFTDNSYYNYGGIAVLVADAATATVTLDGTDLAATLDVANGLSEQPNSVYDWPFIDRFDRSTEEWLPSLPLPRLPDGKRYSGRNGWAISYGNDPVLIYFGAFDGASTDRTEFFELNTTTNVITQRASLPFVSEFPIQVPGARIHLLSEAHTQAGPGEVGIYNPGTDSWTTDVLEFDLSRAPQLEPSSYRAHTPGFYGLGLLMTETAVVSYDEATLTATVVTRVPVSFVSGPVMWMGPESAGLLHYYGTTIVVGTEPVFVHAIYNSSADEWTVERTEWFGPLALDYAWYGTPVVDNLLGWWLRPEGIFAFSQPQRDGVPDYRHTNNVGTLGYQTWSDDFFVDWEGGDMSALLDAQDVNALAAEYPVATGPLGYFAFDVRPGHVFDLPYTNGSNTPLPVENLNGLTDPVPAWEVGSTPPGPLPAGPYTLTVTHSRQVGGVQEDVDTDGMYVPTLIPGMTFRNAITPTTPGGELHTRVRGFLYDGNPAWVNVYRVHWDGGPITDLVISGLATSTAPGYVEFHMHATDVPDGTAYNDLPYVGWVAWDGAQWYGDDTQTGIMENYDDPGANLPAGDYWLTMAFDQLTEDTEIPFAVSEGLHFLTGGTPGAITVPRKHKPSKVGLYNSKGLITYRLDTGTLPPGLVMLSGGTFAGKAEQPGTFTVQVVRYDRRKEPTDVQIVDLTYEVSP